METQTETNGCKCPHHSVVPALIVVFGLLFLGKAMNWWDMGIVDIGWPILVIVGGLMKLMGKKCKCC